MPNSDTLMAAEILVGYAGLEVDGPHGNDTPKRFLDMLSELTRCRGGMGDGIHDQSCIKWKDFPSDDDELITVGPISFVSVCNHHVLPFHGKAWIGYVPDGKVAGLSKFARTVNHFARQLQVQEELTKQIADYLEYRLEPRGVVVHLMAEHTCMTFRGAQSPGTLTASTVTRGVFADHTRTAKAEFLSTIARMQ